MSRIYQPPKSATQGSSQQTANTPVPPIVNNKPAAPSSVKLYVNNLNTKSGSISPSLPTNSSSSSSLSSSFTDKQADENSPANLLTNNNQNDCNTSPINLTKSIAHDLIDEMSHEQLTNLINRLETVTSRLETVAASSASQTSARLSLGHAEEETTPQAVLAFDELLSNQLSSFLQMSAKLGNDVKTIADSVEKVFKYQRSFLLEASKCVQPSQDVLTKFYQLFSKNIEEVTNIREKNRKSEFFNHLSAISESIGALGWIAVQPAPCPYVKEMSDAAQFYTNRVLKDFKEKDPNHATWVKLWLQLLGELQVYVKQYHTTGVVWNSQKKSQVFDPSRVGATTSSSSTSTPAPPPPTGVPPPPPPPPDFAALFADNDSKNQSKAPDTNALFAELNRGGEITSHLKKVSDDQKTHKNPALRGANVVPAVTKSAAPTAKVSSTTIDKPPVFELDDKKWKIEFQKNRSDLVVDQTDLKHTVYIYKCRECTVTVKGKVNSILIDSCHRVGLLFDDVLSTVEFINSSSVQMQVLGRVPTVTIEKTDGCQIYLSKNSLSTEIVSSKSSGMNVLVPSETEENDFSEQPVPEQFKTTLDLKTRKLVTTPTEIC